MDVDDEYDGFFEDLDEATLASLNEIERQNASDTLEERPAKRQKVDHTADFDLDELPEISVQNNFYSTETDTFTSERSQQQVPAIATRHERVNHNLNANANPRPHLPARRSWSTPHQPAQSQAQARPNPRSRSDAAPQARRGGIQRSNSRLAIIASALATSQPQTAVPVNVPRPITNVGPDPETLAQIDELKRKLDELHEENTKIQSALREAQDARYSKEGEVSVLRKHLEKAAKDHASHVEKLKAAREEADSKQLSAQKEMKAEMERLKTQLAFKQQEADANTLTFRKPPPSVRKKSTQPLATTSVPQTPGVNKRVVSIQGHDSFPMMTPMRAKKTARLPPKSPETSRISEPALGFENSFMTPLRPKQSKHPPPPPHLPSRDDNPFDSWDANERDQWQPPTIPRPPSPNDFAMGDALGVEPSSSQSIDQEMVDGENGTGDDDSVSDGPIPQFHRNAELTRVVLSHSHPIAKVPTLQFLVESAASKPEFASAQIFSSSITSILEVMATTSEDFGYEYAVTILTRSLLALINVFQANHLIPPLIAILNLLAALLSTFSDFRLSLLSLHEDDAEQRPKVVTLLSRVIIDHLNPEASHDFCDLLSNELFAFLENLIWDVPSDLLVKVSLFASNRELFSVLFNTVQPHSFLSRSSRFFALLFSYPRMYECCLASQTERNEDGSPLEFSRAVNLDRLCSLLIDVNRLDAEAISMKLHILMFFTALSIAHSDALNLLASSTVFIPSLITHIAYLARPVWEEEDEASFEPQFKPALLTIRTLYKTLALLHHVVFNAVPVVNLPDKFLRAPMRAFNGLNHSFIVTFGRISYAAAPDWITDGESKRNMAGMIEMATELLELVVDGPEGDSLWSMYQDGGAQSTVIDEEEMELEVTGRETTPYLS
ncbi:hypothetical protein PQX77_011332 [Marasmius sp. AFHP31]|nr:hypothetical protein PQX77_011332 [Marasmius sp. AFHP31]